MLEERKRLQDESVMEESSFLYIIHFFYLVKQASAHLEHHQAPRRACLTTHRSSRCGSDSQDELYFP